MRSAMERAARSPASRSCPSIFGSGISSACTREKGKRSRLRRRSCRRTGSSSRSPAPPPTRTACSWPPGPTRASGSERVSVDAWGFDVERQLTARRLRSLRIRLSASRTAVAAALTLILVFGGAGAVRDCVLSLPVPSWAATVAFLVILFALVMAVDLPFRYISGYRWERAFGLSAQRFAGWVKDLAKAFGLGLGSTVAAGLVLLWLLAVLPTWWWLAAWALGLAVSVVLAFIAPIILLPMFYRFRPLDDPALRPRFQRSEDHTAELQS